MKHEFLYAVEREFEVPISELWRAWTDATSLQNWYHPVGLSVGEGTAVSEPLVGGLWKVSVVVPMDNSEHFFFGKYYTTERDAFDNPDFTTPSHLIVLEFENHGSSSWVRFTQLGEMPEAQIELTRQGTSSYFDSLEEFLGH
jgi:uncharacterized protein YndB with AHSA1/START domain